jgi:Fe-Mn family superoxide dismutase
MLTLPELPYGYDALEPTMSAETLHLHHDKHHARYFAVTNELLAAKGAAPESLEAVVVGAAKAGDKKLFNNAAQAWNHTFFWNAMSPQPQAPQGALQTSIAAAFGDLGGLKTKFTAEGSAHFGSGWVWLAASGGDLSILTTHDGDNLLARPDLVPLLVCDLWEHAYYVDHRNDRDGYLGAWFDRLANWTLAAQQLAAAQGQGRPWRHP